MPLTWRRRLGVACAIAGVLLGMAARAETVSLMVGGAEKQIYLPVVLADRLGYFADEGLDVRLLSEPAGVEAADEMLAGAVQGVIGFYDHNIQLQSLGKYTESVVQFSRVPGEVELVSNKHPEIRSIADLKGHHVGVTGLGSSTDFLTEFLLVKAGLKLFDVTPVPVGAGDTLIAALNKDQIQAAMTTEPTVARLVSSGKARVLVDLRTVKGTEAALGGPYPAACLYMETSWVETHPETVQKLANALVKTLHYIADHSAEEIADHMPSDYFAGGRAMYVSALAAGKEMFTPDGRMPKDGPKTVLGVLSRFMPGVRPNTIDLARTYTTRFVDAVP
ncbi:ABC transporter substrate-binding protein [Solirhodobacter olei]|uniref:ABC transporter substrate-binding protein n=1 Tax=Solirhodobacter olei TaxID=2493082 RepID=UPI000FD7686A|nr:ABC transporter substrate-binding protein [Solirhodobacter olei]